jgi:hypothetical protein
MHLIQQELGVRVHGAATTSEECVVRMRGRWRWLRIQCR